jgi:hypothetical protein
MWASPVSVAVLPRRTVSRRLDSEHAVEAVLDKLVRDLGLDRKNAPPLAPSRS